MQRRHNTCHFTPQNAPLLLTQQLLSLFIFYGKKKLEPAFLRVGSSWVALDDLWWESESQVKDVGIGKLALLTAFYSCVTGTSSWSSPRRGCECC